MNGFAVGYRRLGRSTEVEGVRVARFRHADAAGMLPGSRDAVWSKTGDEVDPWGPAEVVGLWRRFEAPFVEHVRGKPPRGPPPPRAGHAAPPRHAACTGSVDASVDDGR